MQTASPADPRNETASGVLFGGSAFLIWGLSPIYWKLLQSVPAFEVILHRIVWSFLFLLPILLFQGRFHELKAALKRPRLLAILTGTAVLVAINWFLYIWAVTHDRVLQASLGYYINPLVNVLLGFVFLGERLRPRQIAAVFLAAAGVLFLTVSHGVFPWVSLALAFSFGSYGLIRKVAAVGSLVGLTLETLVLGVPAALLMIRMTLDGSGAFLNRAAVMDLKLMGAALVTGLPLLLFTRAARRVTLATLGFLQYLAPTCMFLLGVLVYDEPFPPAKLAAFAAIWTALGLYSADSLSAYRQAERARRQAAPPEVPLPADPAARSGEESRLPSKLSR
jgi:chloramphenicol-sensitive protein RarD